MDRKQILGLFVVPAILMIIIAAVAFSIGYNNAPNLEVKLADARLVNQMLRNQAAEYEKVMASQALTIEMDAVVASSFQQKFDELTLAAQGCETVTCTKSVEESPSIDPSVLTEIYNADQPPSWVKYSSKEWGKYDIQVTSTDGQLLHIRLYASCKECTPDEFAVVTVNNDGSETLEGIVQKYGLVQITKDYGDKPIWVTVGIEGDLQWKEIYIFRGDSLYQLAVMSGSPEADGIENYVGWVSDPAPYMVNDFVVVQRPVRNAK